MSIVLSRETPISLKNVPKSPWLKNFRTERGFGKKGHRGRRLHSSTIHRWCTKGNRRRRLECLQVGGTLVTTEGALPQFSTLTVNTRTNWYGCLSVAPT